MKITQEMFDAAARRIKGLGLSDTTIWAILEAVAPLIRESMLEESVSEGEVEAALARWYDKEGYDWPDGFHADQLRLVRAEMRATLEAARRWRRENG